ncbi:MAG: VaFE repeat-containing surface-anchored protein [Chordicoccus sp.]
MKAGKIASSLLAGVLAASMLVTAVPSAAFADSTASSEGSSASVAASSASSGTDSSVTAGASVSADSSADSSSGSAASSADSSSSSTKQLTAEETEKFASKRLIVSTDDASRVTDGDVLASYGDVYLLQYDTEEAASEAYDYYKSWAKLVDVDTAVSVAADATTTDPTDTVMTESDNPLTALQDTADTGTSGQGMIALIDTGASLGGNVTNAVSMLGGDAADDNGHGTTMVKDITAQNPDAKILSIKAIGADGKGDLSAVYAAIEYAIEQKVSYINLSITAWKAEANSILTDAVAEAENAGITVIGAAGNDGLDASNFVPGSIDQVITVGACDSEGIIRTFSNFGSSVDYYADADSTSDAAATVTGYLSKHGMAALGNAKPLIFAAKDATGSSTYVIPDGATDGPELNEVVSFYEDDGSGNYDIRLQDYIDGRVMKSKIYNGEMVAPVVFSRLDLPKIAKLEVFTGFMDPEKETDITDICTYDANTGLVHIPEKYKDTQVTVRYYMSDQSKMYDYMFADLSGETFTIANDDRAEFDKPAATIASDYIDNVSYSSTLGFLTSEGHAGFYSTTEDISDINENDIFVVTNGQTAISTSHLNTNAIYEMNIKARTDPRNKYGVINGHAAIPKYEPNIFLNHFTTVLGDTKGSPYKDKECRALEHIGETGSGKLQVATNSGQRNPALMPLYNEVDGWLVGYCCYDHLNGKIPVWNNQYSRIKCIRKTVNADGSIVEYFYYQMSSDYAQYNAGIFALKYVPQTRGRVAVQVQKVDENGNKVAEAGFQFSAYVKQGVSTSTNISDYTYIGSAPTNSQGLVGLATGKVGTGASTLDAWKQRNPTWTFLIQETAVPANSKYQLNSPNNPVLVTVNLANTKPDSLDPTLFWANGTATFTPNGNKGTWKDGIVNFTNPVVPVKGNVAMILQKTDADTGENLKISGITFDVYLAKGKPSTTDTNAKDSSGDNIYTKLGSNLTTNSDGQIGVLASKVGTEAASYADWVKANPEWTFLIKETSVPEGSGYTLNTTPATVTLETADADVDSSQHIYYLKDMFGFVNYRSKTPKIKTTATSSGSHDVMLNEKTLDTTTVTINDVIDLSDLYSGTTYTIKGELHNAATGAKIATATAKDITFTATGDTSTQTMTFTVPAKDVANVKTVVYEKLYMLPNTTSVVASETDATEAAQTVSFTTSKLATTAKSGTTGMQQADALSTKETVVDTVKYSGLIPGKSYTVSGTLMDKSTGKALTQNGKEVTASKTFTPSKADGTVDVTFTFDATILAGKSVVAFEKLTYEGNEIASHEDISDTDQTVYVPKIGTTAVSKATGDHMASALEKTATLVDTVKYTNLIPGKSYTVSGTLMDKSTGKALTQNGKTITASTTFTPSKADGTVDVTFTYDATQLSGQSVVAFEKVSYNGTDIASHEDISDTDQTVYIPKIGTTAVSKTTGNHTASALEKTATLVDTVKYTNLIPGKSYTVSGTLMDKSTGKALTQNGKTVTASKTFTPDKADGTVDVTFTFDATQLSGKSVVVFEKASYDGKDIASHEDLTDTNQTVYVPKIGTTAVSKATGEHMESALSKTATLVDTVKYTNLVPGKSYTVSGTLMDKSTGKALTQNGKTITASTTFTPSKADGTVDVTFTYDATQLSGKSVVAFEKVSYNGTDICTHEDISDTDQTVYIPSIGTTAKGGSTGMDFALAVKGETIVDTVKYTNLMAGSSYTLHGVLMDKATGKEVLTSDKDVTFTVPKSTDGSLTKDGTADVTFTIGDASKVEGKTLVAFEYLTESGKTNRIASHEDLKDTAQTVYIPSVRTTAVSAKTLEHAQFGEKGMIITDKVDMTGLKTGEAYIVRGTLMSRATGKAVTVDGKSVTADSGTFTADKAAMTKNISFTFDGSSLEGDTVVAFEKLYVVRNGKETEVGRHEDITDSNQSVTLTVHGPVLKAGGRGTYAFYIIGAAVIVGAVVLLALRKRKRG